MAVVGRHKLARPTRHGWPSMKASPPVSCWPWWPRTNVDPTRRSTITVKPMLLVSPTSALSPTPLVNDTLCAPVDLDFVADAPNASGWVIRRHGRGHGGFKWSLLLHLGVEAPTDYNCTQAGLGETYCSSPLTWTLTVVPEPLAELPRNPRCIAEVLRPWRHVQLRTRLSSWSWSGVNCPHRSQTAGPSMPTETKS